MMKLKKIIRKFVIFAGSLIFSLSPIQSALAAPGTLATAPLFLSTIVEPNVFFTLDDSGSMDWGPIIEEGLGGFASSMGLPQINGRTRGYYSPTFNQTFSTGIIPPYGIDIAEVTVTGDSSADIEDKEELLDEWNKAWLLRNHNGNRNYYNPAITYTPWAGSNADGTPMYTDADPTAALKDPNDPGGQSMDLTVKHSYTENIGGGGFGGGGGLSVTTNSFYVPVYFIWDDTDGDGVIETDDDKTLVEIAPGSEEMKNFANWFQYYRSRMNATKAIIGSTINNTDSSRMGISLFNDGHLEDVASMSDPSYKRNLLKQLYAIDNTATKTPARRALEDVGDYFKKSGASAPILSAADGGECQQNFNIMMSDGFWNGQNPSVGNADSNSGSGSSIFDGDESQSNDGGNYADGYSNTLADVAMHLYETDLRGDLANNVPTQEGVDEADHQHLVTYSIAFGLKGTLDPTTDDPRADGFVWPNPVNGDEEKVDDLWHASYNARGQYLSAQNPEQLAESLDTAISDIAERTATAAAVSINSAKLTTESVVYLAQFNTNRWQGNLFAYKIADLGTGELATSPEWNAAGKLNARNIVSNPRVILTHDGSDGTPFQWGSLSSAQRADLKTNPGGGVDSDLVGAARLGYLRGDRSDEGSGNFFRERLSLLGDLVNSGPVFVGKPALNWPDKSPFPSAIGSRYSDFKNGSAASREGVVYAGANDGMLHGFAEADGEEVLAYIPNNLFSSSAKAGLHYLTDQNYTHKYYNDLTPSLSDIYANLGNGTQWQTVLISGQRGGGRGIYALNVNDPGNFNEANADQIVLWEFTSDDDPDLGFTYSRPQIGMANDGTWVAIFGNGYNDIGSGEAKLFIVDIAAGADGSWDSGDYIEITTNSGNTSNRNGLATPALADLDGNGTIDRVYAGDLRGQMWSFDLSNANSTDWDLTDSDPLFTTKNNMPITAQPTLAKHPVISSDGSNAPNIMVYFGSGQYLTNADKSNTDDNYFYGVWDKGDNGLEADDLVEQTFDNSYNQRVLTRKNVDYAGGADYGWFFELPDSGERSVTRPVVRGKNVFFNSFVPVSDPCSVGGYGYRFAVDLRTGGSPEMTTIDVNNDGVIDDNDRASNGLNTDAVVAIQQEGFLPEPVFIEDIAFTAETPSKVIKLKKLPIGRFSWQELIK